MSQFVQGRNAIKGKTLNLKSLHSLSSSSPSTSGAGTDSGESGGVDGEGG
jgi:hypothetical protein